MRWMQCHIKLAECITLTSNWEHGHREVKTAQLSNAVHWEYHLQLQYHAELIMCKEVWLPNLTLGNEAVQCITHHSESVFNFSTGCETWCDETGAERLPAAETQRDFLWSWRLLMEGAIQVYASDALNLSCAVKKKIFSLKCNLLQWRFIFNRYNNAHFSGMNSNGYSKGCCAWSTGSVRSHGWPWVSSQLLLLSSSGWA